MSGYYREKKKPMSTKYKEYRAKETVEDVIQYPFADWPEAGIKKSTMERFGCRVKISESVPNKIDAVYFPAYNKDGSKIIGYQKKDLTIPKEEDFHFTNIGTVRVVGQMYMQKQSKHGGKTLWICEGWKDGMSAYQSMKESIKDKPYRDMEPCVVSIVGGTSNGAKSVAHNEEFVKSFNRIIICMDPDYRKDIEPVNVVRGREAADEIGSYLSSDNVFVPNYQDEKDLNEIMIDKGFKFLNDLIVWDIKPFQAERIITFDEVISFEEAISPIEQGVMLDGFPKLNEALLGFRPHELTTFTGLPGSGKSTFAFECFYQFVEQGYKVGLIMLEDPLKKTQQRISARYLQVNPKNYFLDPQSCGKSVEELKAAWEYSINPNNFMVLNHFGSIASKSLMSKVKALTASGCYGILIDHASMSVSGLETNDERKDLDILYTELAAFRAAHPVHVGVVCHVDKKAGTQDNTRPSEPKWNHIHAANLRGTAGIFQLSCNVILLHTESLPDGSRGRVKIGIGKNRIASTLGDTDIVKTNRNGIFYDAENDVWTPKTQGY